MALGKPLRASTQAMRISFTPQEVLSTFHIDAESKVNGFVDVGVPSQQCSPGKRWDKPNQEGELATQQLVLKQHQ